jgi:hypothetical protein
MKLGGAHSEIPVQRGGQLISNEIILKKGLEQLKVNDTVKIEYTKEYMHKFNPSTPNEELEDKHHSFEVTIKSPPQIIEKDGKITININDVAYEIVGSDLQGKLIPYRTITKITSSNEALPG